LQRVQVFALRHALDGADLAEELVKGGLARSFGVHADGPAGRSAEEYEDTLDDLELQAAKRGAGIWFKTNWDKLPGERRAQRMDEEEADLAIGDGKLEQGKKLDPNMAARDELMKLPGIGELLANRIIEAREQAPFEKPEDLLRVPGIKQKTLDKLTRFLEFKQP